MRRKIKQISQCLGERRKFQRIDRLIQRSEHYDEKDEAPDQLGGARTDSNLSEVARQSGAIAQGIEA